MNWIVSMTAMTAWRDREASHSLVLDGRPEDTGRLLAVLREHGGDDAVWLADEIGRQLAEP